MNDPAKNPYTASADAAGAAFTSGAKLNTVGATVTMGWVITAALLGGVVLMTALMIYLAFSDPPEEGGWFRFGGDSMLLLIVGYVVFFGGVVGAIAARLFIQQQGIARFQARQRELPEPLDGDTPLPAEAQHFVGSLMAATLVGQALLEGPAIANAILMMLESNLAHLVPIGLAAIGIVLQVPTRDRWVGLLEQYRR